MSRPGDNPTWLLVLAFLVVSGASPAPACPTTHQSRPSVDRTTESPVITSRAAPEHRADLFDRAEESEDSDDARDLPGRASGPSASPPPRRPAGASEPNLDSTNCGPPIIRVAPSHSPPPTPARI